MPSATHAAGYEGNARLEALKVWADRLHGYKGKESWERVFRPGANLWRGLCFTYDFIENYGTGGGLCRPLFAEFLSEAGAATNQPGLSALAERYAELGRQWSELAESVLPDDVPSMRRAKELSARRSELLHNGGSVEEVRTLWEQLGELERQAGARFPLTDADCAALRAQLQTRVIEIYESEVAAQTMLLENIPPR
jgi:Domain of unknown function (DUF4872)